MALQCPRCGLLVHRARLAEISARAVQAEYMNPPLAAALWREAMDLLPPDSPQYAQLAERIRWLGFDPAQFRRISRQPLNVPLEGAPVDAFQPPRDSWRKAILKTGGSLLLNIPLYGLLMYQMPLLEGIGWGGAMAMGLGFLLLILVHEFGHVLAMRYYGLSASPPVFIPFVGALINLRQQPPNAKVEAVVGIGGPALGTVGAIVCFVAALALQSPHLLVLSLFGFVINLFNMIPVPPMDGGRIMAAVSPWVWILGVVVLFTGVAMGQLPMFLPILILFLAMPRIIDTLGRGRRRSAYYQISRRASWTIGIAYTLLTALLIALFIVAQSFLIG